MTSKSEMLEKKKQIIKDVLDYSYATKFISSIEKFDHKNTRHLILALRNYRNKVTIVDEEEKRIINHMIANDKNVVIVKDLTLEELIEEAYKRIEITKNYIKNVVEKLKNDK